ncbi:hypothetical protein ACFWG5_34345 [Streptomyces hydrogenans]|uniref:hypothetical protein n=1 Tax=Streptomyces TaxID=1883 RepID=UPI00363C42D2
MTGPSSNPRPRVDQLTEDDLDALHAQLEASEAATAMFKARAEQAEAERDDARADRDTVDRLRKAALDGRNAAVQRADRAEAAIARVRAVHVRNGHTGDCEHCSAGDYPNYAVPDPCPTLRALDGTT